MTNYEKKPSKQQKKVFFSTIEKFTKSQKMKTKLIAYIEKKYPHLLKNISRKERIKECCNTVSFRRYIDTGNIKLEGANFCKYDRICIACATKRAMKMIKRFSQGIKENGLYKKKRYYIVLTISHTSKDELSDLMERLMLYKKRLARAYRNSKRKTQKSKSFFSQFKGMVISIEISHKGKNGRHPHINILACSEENIAIEKGKYARGQTNDVLMNEWKYMTDNTSYIHNIRKINVQENHFSRSGIGEVFKYAIKFSDLNIEQLAEIMNLQHKNRYRFFATYGCFRGWKLSHNNKDKGGYKKAIFEYSTKEKVYQLGSHYMEK